MFPTDDEIAFSSVVPVVSEIPTAELKLNSYTLPAVIFRIDAMLGFAVRVARLHRLNDQPEFVADHTEQVHHTLFVYRCMAQTLEVDRCPNSVPSIFAQVVLA